MVGRGEKNLFSWTSNIIVLGLGNRSSFMSVENYRGRGLFLFLA